MLKQDYQDVCDNREAQGMANMLGRKILIITSAVNGEKSQLYLPFNIQSYLPIIALGHIDEKHFVPLQKHTSAVLLAATCPASQPRSTSTITSCASQPRSTSTITSSASQPRSTST